MNTFEISNLLSQQRVIAPIFKGVFASDLLPSKVSWPCCLIVNTDTSKEPGKHWVAVYINKYGVGEYFDSYGLPPYTKSIITFLNSNCKYWRHNHSDLQSYFSKLCGQYCIIYLLYKSNNMSLYQFIRDHKGKNAHETDFNLFMTFEKYFPKINVLTKKQYYTTLCQCCKARMQ